MTTMQQGDLAGLVLHAQGLHKSFNKLAAVAGISLQVARGECIGLLGPNGAGKSTTLKMCLGLTPPDTGEIFLLGQRLPAGLLSARQHVGVVSQDDNLDPDFSVMENLVVYARYYRLTTAEVQERIPRLLEIAGLQDRQDSQIRQLSGGMRRRLVLARALVNEPLLVFLDEPTTGLDPHARHLYWESLRILKNQGRALFLTTHYMEEAERLCDRVYIVDQGRIITMDSPRALVKKNVEREVVEIHGDKAQQWVAAQPFQCRTIMLGQVVYCYADDVAQLTEAVSREPRLAYTSRSTNLEDVYLRKTGHALWE